MKKGFTLVEMIAVILVMFLISITVIPSILNQVNNKKEEISETSMLLIKTSTNKYLESMPTKYSKTSGNIYYVTLNDVVESGELSSPIKDVKTGNEISLTTKVKAAVNEYNDFELCLVGIEDDCE